MRKPTRSSNGFTLVEVLIAAAILVVVLGIVTRGLVGYLGYTGHVQTNVNVQTQLRRTMELVTQDLRNASFGMLAKVPYASDKHDVSLMQMDETSAYQVLKGAAQTAQNFQNADNFQVVAPNNLSWAAGDLLLLLSPNNGQGTALVLSKNPGATGHDWTAVHSNQANTICWDQDMMAVKATAIGYRFDATNKLLIRATGVNVTSVSGTPLMTAIEQPVAFNVDDFTLGYIGADGASYDTPDAATAAGTRVVRVAVTLKMSGKNGRQTVSKELTSYVELPQQFTLTSSPLQFVETVQGSPNIQCP